MLQIRMHSAMPLSTIYSSKVKGQNKLKMLLSILFLHAHVCHDSATCETFPCECLTFLLTTQGTAECESTVLSFISFASVCL